MRKLPTIKSISSYLILSSVYVTGLGWESFGFTFYWYYPIYTVLALYGLIVYRHINVKVFSVFGLILLFTLVTHSFGLSLIIKQMINIFMSLIVFYYFIVLEEYNILKIFASYINLSKIILVIGFLQVFLYSIGKGILFKFFLPMSSARLQSIAQEPSSIALAMAPIIFLSFYNLFYKKNYLMNKTWDVLFIIGYLLTQSSIAYIGLILMLLFLYLKDFSLQKLKVFVFALVGIFLVGLTAYKEVEEVKLRFDDTLYGISGDFSFGNKYKEVNLSTYALLSNLYVTIQSFKESPFIGNGLGTHEIVYDKFVPLKFYEYSILNRQDGSAMAFRLITETGLIGLILFCMFLFKYRIKSNAMSTTEYDLLWVLNNGILIVFILALLRSGNYTIGGKILFLLIYYYSYKHKNLRPSLV